mmetsp:Transcript_75942/g.111182  ORF Transcript_75942/g.111182 Transcript_75942/m.111182 type:complete len:106 (-) Transcript_75942:405-722(-)
MSVARGSLHFKNLVVNGEERHIKRTSTQIINENITLAGISIVFFEAVGDGRCCGLVYDAQHVEPADESGVFGSLALGVVKIGWYCDDCMLHLSAQESFSSHFHLS